MPFILGSGVIAMGVVIAEHKRARKYHAVHRR